MPLPTAMEGPSPLMVAATSMARSDAAAAAPADEKDSEPLFSSVAAVENFVETAGSLLTSSLLLLVQDTTRPLLHILLLGVLVNAWIAIDYYMRLAISLLPKSYSDWAEVFKKISRFIAYSLIFLFVNYAIQAINIEGSAGRLNVAETGVLITILLILAYTFISVYNSWPRCAAMCQEDRPLIKLYTPEQEELSRSGVPRAGPVHHVV